jgi:hypothetical protein
MKTVDINILKMNQSTRGDVLRSIVEQFRMQPSSGGALAWGLATGYIQSSLRPENGVVKDLRMSNTRTAQWEEGMGNNGRAVIYHLPMFNSKVHPESVSFMMATRGMPINLRISIFPSSGNPPTRDFVSMNGFVIDPNYNGGPQCLLLPVA